MAQQQDMHTWYGFKMEGELNKKMGFSFEPELRLYENASQVHSWLTEFSMFYELHKRLAIGGLYRYQVEYDKFDYNERIHRTAIYLNFNYKIQRWRWRYRAMLQNENRNFLTSADGLNNYLGHRHKLSLKYYRKKWKFRPSIGMEYYFPVRPTTHTGRWKRRYIAAVDYRWSKELNVGLSYKMQDEFNVREPEQFHIFQLGLEFKPKFLKR
ncbi:DUF2490 domain-containing protein [Carboxylicivirga sp. N1Y132]|uniref:DUF2490 domain-containing protein n=1 Tax=Carboxylicivirga marina TaxID=2800988 RepID=A0ABS1HP58_9BACT|nr:DUF2490 domain-containing protein [Carboxylicivirga marina]